MFTDSTGWEGVKCSEDAENSLCFSRDGVHLWQQKETCLAVQLISISTPPRFSSDSTFKFILAMMDVKTHIYSNNIRISY